MRTLDLKNIILAAMPALAVAALTLPAHAQSAADEAAIRDVIVEMTEGFNRHDAIASTRVYTPDADLVTVRGERFRGTIGFQKGLAGIFATRAREATQRTLNVSVRFIRPDVVLAHVTNELSGLIGPDGQRPAPHQELCLRVFVKNDGKWQVGAFHNTLVQPFGSTPAK